MRDEDELAARTIWRITDVVHEITLFRQRGVELFAIRKPKLPAHRSLSS